MRFGPTEPETVFDIFMAQPGDLRFYKINWSENRYGNAAAFQAISAPHDFLTDEEDE
jgi:hypothetical protein